VGTSEFLGTSVPENGVDAFFWQIPFLYHILMHGLSTKNILE